MKAELYDLIETVVDVTSGWNGVVIARGTQGTVVEAYQHPEGYAVDLGIPNDSLVEGLAFENVILTPDQFEVVRTVPVEAQHTH